jgi:hypothetical protein
MDHSEIEAGSLIERYHQGRLPVDEELRFEAHLTACPQCQEQLEMARGLQAGLRAMIAEDAARTAQLGLVAWFVQRRRSLQAVLILSPILVAVGLAVALSMIAGSSLRREAAEARAAAEDWRQQLAESERRRSEEQSLAEARLAELDAASPSSEEGRQQPLINTPLFLLAVVRGDPAEPATTIDLGLIDDQLILAVDAGGDSRFASYRVTIANAGGARLWRQGGLLPNALETLMVTFPASFFAPGDYRLNVEGLGADGSAIELDRYRFRIVNRQ